VPDWQTSQAGPFDLWPTGLGFEYFYGFIGGDTDQWHPALFEGTKPIEAPNDPNYHLDRDLADHAASWIRQQHSLAPDKPFFVYYTPGLCHAPHHAPKEWIAKFEGKFAQGWDKVREETLARQIALGVVPDGTRLTERPKEIPSWDSITDEGEKQLYAHMMEVYAGCLAYTDDNIGRVIQAVEKTGELDNTLIIFLMGDNGASAEGTLQGLANEVGVAANGVVETLAYLKGIKHDDLGGPLYYNHYPVGWAHAMCTPFQWTKQVASHFGGTANNLVISWPKGINPKGNKMASEVRSQFSHVIDIAPTILEAAKLPAPTMINGVKQKSIEGTSLVYTFNDAEAATKHTRQYFEMVGNRAIYDNGWMASTTPKRMPWAPAGAPSVDPTTYEWELYHVAEDFSQANNVVAKNLGKLEELKGFFAEEAKKYNVYPIDSSFAERADVALRPSLTRGRNTFTYYPGDPGPVRIPEGATPDVKNRDFTITADIGVSEGQSTDGVLATQGGRFGGWGLLLIDNKPEFHYAFSNQEELKYSVASDARLAAGNHTIKLDFKYHGPGAGKSGTGTLSVDGVQVAQREILQTIPVRFSLDETFDIGMDTGTPVVEKYVDKMPFKFTGTLKKVVIELGKSGLTANDEKKLKEQAEKLSRAVE
jgi:arylsulfatase